MRIELIDEVMTSELGKALAEVALSLLFLSR